MKPPKDIPSICTSCSQVCKATHPRSDCSFYKPKEVVGGTMKLTMEIKDGKFSYDYIVGEGSKGHGDMPLCVDNLVWFVQAIEMCHKQFGHKVNRDMKEWEVLAYIEKNRDFIKGENFIKLSKDMKKDKA